MLNKDLPMLNFSVLDTADREVNLASEQFHQIIDYSTLSTGNPIVDEDAKQVIEQSFLYLIGHPGVAEDLAFGKETWQVKIAPNLIKTATVSSVMVGLLYASGATGLAAVVLPAVLPLLFDVTTIRLSVKDNLILSEMRLNESLRDTPLDPQVIYRQLRPEIQSAISFSEFLDALDKLCVTGHADNSEKEGLFQLSKEKKFKLVLS